MTQTTDMLKVQLGAVADSKSRTLLKTTTSARRGSALGATLGATWMNNLGMLRTDVDNRERRTRGAVRACQITSTVRAGRGNPLPRGHRYTESALRLGVHFKQDDRALVLPV
jgi:hypothetical protein